MLEDFLETNNVDAEIIALPTETTMDHALAKKIFIKKVAVKLNLFIFY